MGRSTFATIHKKVLCDGGLIMTHVIENDNAQTIVRMTMVNDVFMR